MPSRRRPTGGAPPGVSPSVCRCGRSTGPSTVATRRSSWLRHRFGWGSDACDAAAHGFVGAPDILEHPDGFLEKYADVPLPELATAALGERWHTETLSYKAHPGSAYIGAAIACAADLHRQFSQFRPGDVTRIVVEGSLFTVLADQHAAPFVSGPGSTLAALNFSLGYSTASALLTGALGPADFTEPALSDPTRWMLADLVCAVHDRQLSAAAMLATAPVGEALRAAGERAREWVAARAGAAGSELLSMLDGPAMSFEHSSKRLGAGVTVHFADGRQISATRAAAPGSIGWGHPAEQHRLVRAKFSDTGGDPWVADAVENLQFLTAREVRRLSGRALNSCSPAA